MDRRSTSVQLTAQMMQRLRGMRVARGRLHGALELAKRVPPAPLLEIDTPKVHEGKLARLVACRLLGLLQPEDGLVEPSLLHQVDPDVVVGVAEVGVDLDRAEALGRGLLQSALEAQGPAQEGVGLRRGVNRDGDRVYYVRLIGADGQALAFSGPTITEAPDGAWRFELSLLTPPVRAEIILAREVDQKSYPVTLTPK